MLLSYLFQRVLHYWSPSQADSFGCLGNTIRLRSGGHFDFANPTTDQVKLSDIAGALSKMCRFGGQINRPFYSIAEHLYNCERLAWQRGYGRDVRAAVLMHDATEAYTQDIVKPLKIMLEPIYQTVESRVERAIARRFGIDFDYYHSIVKEIDHIALFAEKRALFDGEIVAWPGEDTVAPVTFDVQCWWPPEAEKRFLESANELGITDSATKVACESF
jgi:5'-deoxynucleotidase YfbR-like HD superfamily hydrolase